MTEILTSLLIIGIIVYGLIRAWMDCKDDEKGDISGRSDCKDDFFWLVVDDNINKHECHNDNGEIDF